MYLRQAQDIIMTQNRVFGKIVQKKTSIKTLKNSAAFYKDS